jgi:NAD(P)-dependent dehydrogenase (short-subunit alcohol dehydrogenase family)
VARVFITGSSDGLSVMAARLLISQGHEGCLHGRNEDRSRNAITAVPVLRELSLAILHDRGCKNSDRFDAVIHNAGVGYREGRVETEPGVPSLFAINVLAPYILTALIERPKRLVYVSSGCIVRASAYGRPALDQPTVERVVGLCGDQAVRCFAGVCRRSPLGRGQIQRWSLDGQRLRWVACHRLAIFTRAA